MKDDVLTKPERKVVAKALWFLLRHRNCWNQGANNYAKLACISRSKGIYYEHEVASVDLCEYGGAYILDLKPFAEKILECCSKIEADESLEYLVNVDMSYHDDEGGMTRVSILKPEYSSSSVSAVYDWISNLRNYCITTRNEINRCRYSLGLTTDEIPNEYDDRELGSIIARINHSMKEKI